VFGIVTGSGFYDVPDLQDRAEQTVETPFGSAVVTTGTWHGHSIAFLPRHGSGHSVPPAAINYRANIWALRETGVTSVLATAVSGGITAEMTPGKLVVISDFINFTSGRATTFFDGVQQPFSAGEHHTDMTHAYSPRLRALVVEAAAVENVDIINGGVYCTTDGPRFETPAEIEMMRRAGGDLVGMTGYPEVALAVEAGLEYCSIGVVSNPAAGIAESLSAADIFDLIGVVADPLYRLISRVIQIQG